MTPGRLKIWNEAAGEWQYTPGGSQPIEVVRLPLAFNTPGLVIPASGPAGIKLCDLAVGDILVGATGSDVTDLLLFYATTVWNGSSPGLRVAATAGRGNMPGTPPTQLLGGPLDLTAAVQVEATDLISTQTSFGATLLGNAGNLRATAPTALWLYVDDGADGDPGSSQGAGEVVAVILRAP